jgi:hypothetical protein
MLSGLMRRSLLACLALVVAGAGTGLGGGVAHPRAAHAAGHGPLVLVYGDSVAYGGRHQIANRIRAHGWTPAMITYPGVDVGHVAPNLRRQSAVGDVAVLALGYTYFWKPVVLRRQIDQALYALWTRGVRRVVWLNVRENRAERRDVNSAINAAAKRWGFVDIADWNAFSRGRRDAFEDDGYHLLRAGGRLMGDLIARHLARWRAGAPVSPLPRYGPRLRTEPVVVGHGAPARRVPPPDRVVTRSPFVGIVSSRRGRGYWLARRDGHVVDVGDAPRLGTLRGVDLNAPIVGIAPTRSGRGYWLVASDGGVFSFGDARFFGSTGAIRLAEPVVGMAPTPTGRGYWLVAADGGVFSFGDARFFGSTGAIALEEPIVGMAAHPSGRGYWLAAFDGGVFTFGASRFHGSAAGAWRYWKIQSIGAATDGRGYQLLAASGEVLGYGSARSIETRLPTRELYVAMAPRRGGGLWVLGQRPA